MARTTVKLPSFSNVAAGATATLELPLGLTYDQVMFTFENITLHQMRNLKLIANGKVLQEYTSAARLNEINKYYARGAATTKFLTWFFVRPELKTLQEQRMTAIGTSDLQTLSISLDLEAGDYKPVITAHAIKSNAAPLGLVIKTKKYGKSSATSGEFDIDNITRHPQARIAAIHLFDEDDKIRHVELEMNSQRVIDMDADLARKIQVDYGRRPMDKALSIDFQLEGDIAQSLVMQGVTDMRLKAFLEKPGAFDAHVEFYDQFVGI